MLICWKVVVFFAFVSFFFLLAFLSHFHFLFVSFSHLLLFSFLLFSLLSLSLIFLLSFLICLSLFFFFSSQNSQKLQNMNYSWICLVFWFFFFWNFFLILCQGTNVFSFPFTNVGQLIWKLTELVWYAPKDIVRQCCNRGEFGSPEHSICLVRLSITT